MNSQDLRNLQEAYLDVYQEQVLDEVRGGGKIDAVSDIPSIGERGSRSPKDAGLEMSPLRRAEKKVVSLRRRNDPEATRRANRIDSRFVRPTNSAISRSILAANNAASAEKKRLMNPQESYDPDLFDVILEHLITEGYADTNESALAIMGNMSEDWRESIIEQQTDPTKTAAEMASLRNTAFGSKKFQEKIWLSPSNPKGPNWDPKSVKTPGV